MKDNFKMPKLAKNYASFFSLLILLGVGILSQSFTNCNPINSNPKQAIESKDNFSSNVKFSGLDFPVGTEFQEKGDMISFQLPSGYELLGITQGGSFKTTGGGNIRCKCEKGGSGCSPTSAGGKVGCMVASPCTECKATTSSISGEVYEDAIIFNNNMDLKDVSDFTQLSGRRMLNPKFLDYPKFENKLVEFQNYMKGASRATTSKQIFMEVYGNLVVVEVNSDFDDDSLEARAIGGSGGGATCTCHVGSKCPRKKKMGVTYCDADNCSDCEMSTSVIASGGISKILNIDGGLIILQ